MTRKYHYKPKINKTCKFCGNPAPSNLQGYCQPCYRYFILEGKKIYPLPKYGEITYAENGDAICPECGKAFAKLGGHIYNHHHKTTKEFFKEHGWHIRRTKATNADYRKKMKDLQWDKCITENLIKGGEETRFFQKRGNKPELFNHSAIDRCIKCKHCSENFCKKYKKQCKEILKCKKRKLK